MANIILKDLKKNYGETRVLQGINLEIEEGERVSIVGSSGSGKSTLLYLIGGLDKPTSGNVYINSQDITKKDDEELSLYRNNDLGFIFQFHYLLSSMNALDNILLPAKIGNKDVNSVKRYVFELAKHLQVFDLLKKFPYELSGGEQQRMNIIRALSLKPKVLLCDEPTGNLDSANSQKVVSLLLTLARKLGFTLVLVTHDLVVAGRLDRKITIEDGQIIS